VAWDGRLGVLGRNLRTKKVYWVNVSESFGAGSPRLSWIKSCYMVVVGGDVMPINTSHWRHLAKCCFQLLARMQANVNSCRYRLQNVQSRSTKVEGSCPLILVAGRVLLCLTLLV